MKEMISTWNRDESGITSMVELTEHEQKIGGLTLTDLMRWKREQVSKIYAARGGGVDEWFAGTDDPTHYEIRVVPLGVGVLNIEVYFAPPPGIAGFYYQSANRATEALTWVR